MQHLFGDSLIPWRHHGANEVWGYNFGLGLLDAPFYALGKLLSVIGIGGLDGQSTELTLVVLGTFVYAVVGSVLLFRLLGQLDLPARSVSIVASAFGTPFFCYVVFFAGKDHVADASLFTLVLVLTLAFFRSAEPSRHLLWGLGAVLGFSVTVRYFAVVEGLALVAVLCCYRQWRHAVHVAASATLAACCLFALPVALGTPLTGGDATASGASTFSPLNPLRMLFTDHRGMFVWSPVTLLAVFGLVALYRARPAERRFLTAAYAMGLAIVVSYAFSIFWDGSWAFGQRYYTSLFPLVGIGLAALIQAARGFARVAVRAAIVGTTLWMVYLGFVLATVGQGVYVGPSIPDGALEVAHAPAARAHLSVGSFAYGIYFHARIVKALVPWPFATR